MDRSAFQEPYDVQWDEESPADAPGFVQIRLPAVHATPRPDNLDATELSTGCASSPWRRGGSFPQHVPDWSNQKVLHRNTLPPRASFHVYNSVDDALARNVSKSKTVSLNGTWKFKLAKSPFDTFGDLLDREFESQKWGNIKVPGMWQLQGYGKGPQYTNVNFPFPVDPPNIPFDDNETGCYLRTFELPRSFRNHQIRLRFEGVDSSFHVFINDNEVGYSQGSRNPSEFDITEFVEEQRKNTLFVRVYQRCDGTYLEDQDQWWLSGIFRDVNLLAFPKIRIEDLQIQTHLDQAYTDATLSVRVTLNTPSDIGLSLYDAGGVPIIESRVVASPTNAISIFVQNPQKWTADTPYLYQLVLTAPGCVVEQRVGFRTVQVKRGVFCVNGKPVKIRGVNRHEHHPDSGRAVPYDFLRQDLLTMKRHNINAIRTSHYINDPRLYDLADEFGLWILDECDLECHGFGEIDCNILQKGSSNHAKGIEIKGNPARWVSDNPEWTEAYIDRARQAVVRDKNHPSIILWSLGNESFYGRNHQAMYDFIHAYDPTRPIHYEGDYWAQTADIYSRMYTSAEEIIRFVEESQGDTSKPLVMCEYVHAMGTGPGAVKEYVDAFYKYPRLMGGFVWEWANHGLRTKTARGEEYYGYGGDFGDDPNDGHFVLDGLCNSDHTPTSGLTEYKKTIEPVQIISGNSKKVKIINRYDHADLDHLKCTWTLVGDGFRKYGGLVEIPTGIQRNHTAELEIEGLTLPELPGCEIYLEVSFTLRHSTNWAPAGHEVAFGQIRLTPVGKRPLISLEQLTLKSPTALQLQQISPQHLRIGATPGNNWIFNIVHGTLTSWTSNGKELLHTPPELTFYRAVTDNDRPTRFGQSWIGSRLHQTKNHVRSVTYSMNGEGVTVKVEARIAPPVLQWSIETEIIYTFNDAGVTIKVRGKPRGQCLPNTFARLGLEMGLKDIESASWFGRGPGEAYRDMKLSQKYGNYTLPISKLFTNPEYPQDNGNRTDVRHVTFNVKNDKKASLKASFGTLEEASFSAMNYTTKDIDESQHPYELYKKKKDYTVVKLDWVHMGIGTGSCGPATLDEYVLKCEDFEYEILLS
ncbi:family 2 glycosyl hydrolase [Tricladium varicosporioides]|nr:family 2 glycosyl hydrolase [Hymenoscyphus varicosporioides]